MRIMPPSDQVEQVNEYLFEDWVPVFLDEVTIGGVLTPLTGVTQLPSTSYRIRWNERTLSWTADWFDQDGEVIDQGRRLSTSNWIRAPWGNFPLPDPMPSWIAVLEVGDTGAEMGFEDLGRDFKLVEFDVQDLEDAGLGPAAAPDVTIAIL